MKKYKFYDWQTDECKPADEETGGEVMEKREVPGCKSEVAL